MEQSFEENVRHSDQIMILLRLVERIEGLIVLILKLYITGFYTLLLCLYIANVMQNRCIVGPSGEIWTSVKVYTVYI